MVNLLLTVLLPISVGQAIFNIFRYFKREHWLGWVPVSPLSNAIVLFVFFTVFSDAFVDPNGAASPLQWLLVGGIISVNYVLISALAWGVGSIPQLK